MEADPELVISTEELLLSNAGGIKSVHIKSNLKWQASGQESWLSVTPDTGDPGTVKIEVTVEKNPSPEAREGSISVTAGSLKKSLKVVQAATYLLTVDKSEFELTSDGGLVTFQVTSSGPYQIASDSDWLRRDGLATEGNETFKAGHYSALTDRTALIMVTLGDVSRTIAVIQKGSSLSIPADPTGMPSDALPLAQKMTYGWNLGNALESVNGNIPADETLWGNPKTTGALIDSVKAAGFNAVRIPCAWSGYIVDPVTYKIRDSWLQRVQEVVDYCVGNDMFAILNIHWDGGWLEENPTYAKQAEVLKKQKAIWQQIAVHFRNYDERLLFAGTNEVRADYNEPKAENIEVQLSYNQNFVDAVRATGGRNTWRNLVVQAYNTNIGFADRFFQLPSDPTPNRLLLEVHYYDPWDFALDLNSDVFLWGKHFKGQPHVSNWGQEDWADTAFGLMKSKFADNGIPVILGEYCVTRRNNLSATQQPDHIKARNYYLWYVTKAAKDNGLVPFYWDSGHTGHNASGLFDRSTYRQAHPDAIKAIMGFNPLAH